VNKKLVYIPIVGDPDLIDTGRAKGAMDSQTDWNVVSAALTYEGRIYC